MTAFHDDLPTSLHSAAQVRDLDARLIAAGTPGFDLMQRAARATWNALRRRWPDAGALTVLAGHGNNAGDGYLVAVLATRAGWQVRVLAVGEPTRLEGDARRAHAEALAAGVEVLSWSTQSAVEGVAVDALLGTGFHGTLRAPYAEAIRWLNASGAPILAVDLPSGLEADSGRVPEVAVRAELTVTFIGLKLGLFSGEGADMAGDLVFDDLQADAALREATPAVARRLAREYLPTLAPRARTAHKGQFGHVLVVGGDLGLGGSVLLSTESALRAGAGLVSLATRGEHVPAALARMPEVMARGVRSANQLHTLVDKADVLVVGPGLGQDAWGRSLLSIASGREVPQVWDADALNLLASGGYRLPPDAVITPHPGEAGRLLGRSTADVQADRPAAARALVERFGCCVILKGAGSLVAAPGQPLSLCDRGHPAMAGAGFGDVLAGLVGALRGQGLSAYDAACLAVWLHASAGERLGQGGRGMTASDLIPAIRQLLEEVSPCRP
ncbi:NAD(P)H-hydrate dehydratase [Pseudomonas mangiferae]|uniref:Bifunctional NAD(P)H-hydrate repair enzyme n=1 Tax=Pseudomonas mangiferae TaxID=2593654 RepID=A0A553GWX7_9PSED|nr:NAD(P)H-hydrate dehydratase [Pseudomonas mangiferae]TRX74009.1 NAD(P)H-hydrate dehydratase [Pseudomonas mangiferae]